MMIVFGCLPRVDGVLEQKDTDVYKDVQIEVFLLLENLHLSHLKANYSYSQDFNSLYEENRHLGADGKFGVNLLCSSSGKLATF